MTTIGRPPEPQYPEVVRSVHTAHVLPTRWTVRFDGLRCVSFSNPEALLLHRRLGEVLDEAAPATAPDTKALDDDAYFAQYESEDEASALRCEVERLRVALEETVKLLESTLHCEHSEFICHCDDWKIVHAARAALAPPEGSAP